MRISTQLDEVEKIVKRSSIFFPVNSAFAQGQLKFYQYFRRVFK